MREVEPMFNPMINLGDAQVDVEQETVHYHGQSIALTMLTRHQSNTMALHV